MTTKEAGADAVRSKATDRNPVMAFKTTTMTIAHSASATSAVRGILGAAVRVLAKALARAKASEAMAKQVRTLRRLDVAVALVRAAEAADAAGARTVAVMAADRAAEVPAAAHHDRTAARNMAVDDTEVPVRMEGRRHDMVADTAVVLTAAATMAAAIRNRNAVT